jgi:DNA repair protein RadC
MPKDYRVINHVLGDPEPSQNDISLTQRLMEAGEILGIPLVDHMITGSEKYINLKEKGLI